MDTLQSTEPSLEILSEEQEATDHEAQIDTPHRQEGVSPTDGVNGCGVSSQMWGLSKVRWHTTTWTCQTRVGIRSAKSSLDSVVKSVYVVFLFEAKHPKGYFPTALAAKLQEDHEEMSQIWSLRKQRTPKGKHATGWPLAPAAAPLEKQRVSKDMALNSKVILL